MLPTGPLACVILCTRITLNSLAIFFPVLLFILFSHFCSFTVFWGLGFVVGVLDWAFCG